MTGIAFDAKIVGGEIIASFTPDKDIAAPIWCFSLLAPVAVVAGGRLVTGTGGYAEIALPALRAHQTHQVTIAYADGYRPANRAWLPLGSYLRLTGGAVCPLPALPQGVIAAASPPPAPWQGLRLVPQPAAFIPATGLLQARHFALTHDFPDGERIFAQAHALARRAGFGGLAGGSLPLHLTHEPGLPPESYRLHLRPDGAELQAGDAAGAFYGCVTLMTLAQTHEAALPCGTIYDAPRFGWRGQHLDCARHFYQPETILQLMDLMALLKLNRFHWHLTDDEAFRLVLDCAPDLARHTAMRGEGALIPAVFGSGPQAGGSYDKADVARILAHASELHIAVMPEIELPAHALALTRVRPELRDPHDNGPEISIQGYRQNVLNPAMPAVMPFLEQVIAEIAQIFPRAILHLGCDELPPATWAGSPAALALCAREGLGGRDDLQGWFMAQVAALTRKYGLRPAAWEEAAKGANGGIGHDALLFSWTGQAPGIAAARAGYDVVMCPAQHCYFDMAHSPDPDDWGAAWAGAIPLEASVAWQVIPVDAADILPRVIGVQGAFWSEFTTSDAQIAPMLAPRLLGLALKGWSREAAIDGAGLTRLAASYDRVFKCLNWQTHPAPAGGG